VHEDYPIHCYDVRYEVGPNGNSNKFKQITDFDLKKVKVLT